MAIDKKGASEVLSKQRELKKDERMPVKEIPGIDWHIVNPLNNAGIFYVDQLDAMSWSDIAKIVTGRKNLPNLAKALGREDEHDRYSGKYTVNAVENGQVVATYPASSLKQLSGLAGTAKHFHFDSGADLQVALEIGKRFDPFLQKEVPFTLEDIALYKYGVAQSRQAVEKAKQERGDTVIAQKLTETSKGEYHDRVKELVRRYAQDYDTEQFTQLDWDNLGVLAGMKARIQTLQEAIGSMDIADSAAVADAAKNMASEVTSLVRESRQLEDSLGVSLKARIARQSSGSASDIIMDFVRRAKEFVSTKAIRVRCPACSEKQEGIQLALWVPHFPRHVLSESVRMKCPRCCLEFDFPLMNDDILNDYVEAGDFVPPDMPQDIRDELAKRK